MRGLRLLAVLLAVVVVNAEDYVFNTTYGQIKGAKSFLSDVIYFKGVPFAEPPLKNLRFMPPVPPQKWSGIMDTKVLSSLLTPSHVGHSHH